MPSDGSGGRLAGKVALITGAARGIGQAEAARFAQEGADIVGVDIATQLDSVVYELSGAEFGETVSLVEQQGRRIATHTADVRDQAALDIVVEKTLAEFGHIDIVSANAGIASFGPVWEITDDQFREILEVNVVGAWHTVKAVLPTMIASGEGGALVFTGSTASVKSAAQNGHYSASKHGVAGLMKAVALEGSQHAIRANLVAPSATLTPMLDNKATIKMFRPDLEDPTIDDVLEVARGHYALPIQNIEALDIANAALFLCSDEARCITGTIVPVDGGSLLL